MLIYQAAKRAWLCFLNIPSCKPVLCNLSYKQERVESAKQNWKCRFQAQKIRAELTSVARQREREKVSQGTVVVFLVKPSCANRMSFMVVACYSVARKEKRYHEDKIILTLRAGCSTSSRKEAPQKFSSTCFDVQHRLCCSCRAPPRFNDFMVSQPRLWMFELLNIVQCFGA